MGRTLALLLPIVVGILIVVVVSTVQAFQNNGGRIISQKRSPPPRPPPPSSDVFRSLQQNTIPSSKWNYNNGIVLREKNNDDTCPRSSKLWQRLILSGQSRPRPRPLFTNKKLKFLAASSFLFGRRRNTQIRLWWKSIWKKLVSLVVALCIVFSSGLTPAAKANPSDYFAPPSHSRLVPSKYQIVEAEEVEEVSPTQAVEDEEDYAELERKAIVAPPKTSKKAAKFESSNTGKLALERAASKKAKNQPSSSSAVAETTASSSTATATAGSSWQNDPVHLVVQKNKKVILASLVVAAILGASLGVKLSAGSIGGYKDELGDEFDWPDEDLGWDPNDFDDDDDDGGGGGLMGGYDSDMGGFSPPKPLLEDGPSSSSSGGNDSSPDSKSNDDGTPKAMSQQAPASPDKAKQNNVNSGGGGGIGSFLGGNVGGFSEHQPSEEDDSNADPDTYHNRGFDFFSKISGYKIGYDHDEDELIDENDANEKNQGGLNLGGPAGTFSQTSADTDDVGTFSQYQPATPPSEDGIENTANDSGGLGLFGGDVGGFSQHQPSEEDSDQDTNTYRNRGFDFFSKISGYKIGYDCDEDELIDENDATETNQGGLNLGGPAGTFSQSSTDTDNVGTFSQYKPATPPSDGMENTANDSGGLGLFGGAVGGFSQGEPSESVGGFSQYNPSEEDDSGEETDTHNNRGFDFFSSISGYKTGYDQDDDGEEGVGSFSQHQPEVELENDTAGVDLEDGPVGTFSGSNLGGIFRSWGGTFSEYRPSEQVDTPLPETVKGNNDDGISGSEFRISNDAILKDVEQIEKKEQERLAAAQEEKEEATTAGGPATTVEEAQLKELQELEESLKLAANDMLESLKESDRRAQEMGGHEEA